MIFGIIRLTIWLAGLAVVFYIGLRFFHYDINWDYYNEQKKTCQEILHRCQEDLIKNGLEGVKEKCQWKCVDPKLLIRKPANT